MILELKKKLHKDTGFHALVSGGAISFFMQVAGMFFGYVLMALIANYFGARILGIYSLSYTTLSLIIILSTFGMDMVILKIAGRHENTSSILTLKKIYSIVIPSAAAFTLVLISVGYFCLDSVLDEMEYERYLIITAASVIFSVILAINIEYLRAKGSIAISEFLRNVFRPLISIVFVVVIGLFYYDAYIPGYTLLTGCICACMYSTYLVLWKADNKNARQPDCNETAKTLVASGFPIQISMVAFYMISNMVIYFTEFYESSVLVGLMLVSIKLAGLINMPLMVLNKVCAPRFSKLYWMNQHKELQEYLGQVTKLAFYVALVVGFFLVVFADSVLSIFGDDFVEAKSILFVLVIGQLVSCASGSVGIFMMMTGNEIAYRNIAMAVALVSAVLYFIVMPVYGLIGAACVLALSQAILNIAAVCYIKYRLGFVTMYLPFGNRFLYNL